MKVIFLDNDGVICLSSNWGSRYRKRKRDSFVTAYDLDTNTDLPIPVNYRLDDFDTKAIKVLNDILTETGAEIIVSSDWKRHATVEELGDYYISQGIIKRPIAVTPNLADFDSDTYNLFKWKYWFERSRVLEIEEYLKANPDVTHWVAVDDLHMGKHVENSKYGAFDRDDWGLTNFVWTPRPSEGIKQSGVKDKILKYLI
jgi:hypothetical protein